MKSPFYDRTLNAVLAKMRLAPPYIADFDSASAMLRATAAYLRGEDFPGMGSTLPAAEPIADFINQLPRPGERKKVWGGRHRLAYYFR